MYRLPKVLLLSLIAFLTCPLFAKVDLQDERLLEAAEANEIEVVTQLIREGVDIEYVGEGWFTAYSLAIYNGHLNLARTLEKMGAKVRDLDSEFYDPADTPIISNINRGNYEMVEYLIEKGCSINMLGKAHWDLSPLLEALRVGEYEIFELLLQKGADPLEEESPGNSAFNYAVSQEDNPVRRTLYRYGDYAKIRWNNADIGLVLRSSSSVKGKRLGVIPYGRRVTVLAERDETVTIAGVEGRWTRVKWNSLVGWVFGGFLSIRKEVDLHTLISSTLWLSQPESSGTGHLMRLSADSRFYSYLIKGGDLHCDSMGSWSFNKADSFFQISLPEDEVPEGLLGHVNIFSNIIYDDLTGIIYYESMDKKIEFYPASKTVRQFEKEMR